MDGEAGTGRLTHRSGAVVRVTVRQGKTLIFTGLLLGVPDGRRRHGWIWRTWVMGRGIFNMLQICFEVSDGNCYPHMYARCTDLLIVMDYVARFSSSCIAMLG